MGSNVTLKDATRTFNATIRGDKWVINLYPNRVFKSLFKGCLAITEYHHRKKLRTINFCYKHRDIDTIIHEVTHAYLSYTDFSQMSYGQIEEVFCEILGKRIQSILKVSRSLKRRLYSSKR